jgi:hypothetical protein
MAASAVELNVELLEALAIAAPAVPAESVWNRLVQHGLSRGGRPRKTGDAARPVSGPVTLRELGFRKGVLTEAQKLAAIPEPDFEELLSAYRRDGKKPTASGILRIWHQRPRRARPASLERMAALLRQAGWTVTPPRGDDGDMCQ